MHKYYQVAKQTLDEPGTPVLAWLEQFDLEMANQVNFDFSKMERESI
jgi:hypothetical protein